MLTWGAGFTVMVTDAGADEAPRLSFTMRVPCKCHRSVVCAGAEVVARGAVTEGPGVRSDGAV